MTAAGRLAEARVVPSDKQAMRHEAIDEWADPDRCHGSSSWSPSPRAFRQ